MSLRGSLPHAIIKHMYETVAVEKSQAARGAVDALAPLLDTFAAVAWDTLDGDTLGRCVIDLTRHRDRLDGLYALAIAAQVAEHGAVGLTHLLADPLAARIVGLGQVDRDHPGVVAGEDLLLLA